MQAQGEVLGRGLRLIGRYIRAEPLVFAVSVVGASIFAVSAVGTTVVLGRATDDVVIPAFGPDGTTRGRLTGAMIALVCVAVLRAVSIVLRRYFGAMTGRRTQRRFRKGIADTYLRVPLTYHQTTPTGQLLAHADADVEAATEVIYPLPFSVGVTVLIVFSLISLLLVDPLLTVVALVLFPALALLNRVYSRLVELPAARVQEHVGRVSTVAHESIDGALVVKTLGREADEVDRLAAVADTLRRSRIELGRLRATFEPAISAFPNVGIVALLALGAWEISTGRISTGEMVQAMAIFGILAFPVRVVGFFLQELPRSVVSADRIDGVLAADLVRGPGADALALPPGPLAIEFDAVTFSYGDGPPVLDGCSFRIEPGEVVAVVGSTGSGKSTVCQLLSRLERPHAGAVRLGGVALDRIATDELTAAVSLVFQESFLFADEVRQNIELDRGVGRGQVAAAVRVARADRFVEALPDGYGTVVGERGVTLSGGQRQRVALARALVGGPRLLILDDATSAVDATVEAEILDGLRAALETTTVIVAQRVSTIELADRVLYLADGRVMASGTHEELRATVPAYEAIVRAYEEAAA